MTHANLLVLGCLLATGIAVSGADVPRRTLELRPGAGNPRNSEGAFVTLKNGNILFIYTRFNGTHGWDHGSAELAARTSMDNGETWTDKDVIVVANEGAQNVMSVSLLRLSDGRIALFYLRKNNDFDCRPLLRYSTDEGSSWSAPVECITDQVGYYVLNNDRVIQLRNGRLVMPLCQHSKLGDAKQDYRGTLLCYVSDDMGQTWRRGKQEWQVFGDDGKRITVQEPGVVELKDGRVMMFIRSDSGSQMISYSSDGGDTWTPSKPSVIQSPLSPASIKRIPSTGDLLLVWNNHDGIPSHLLERRVPLAMAVSKDDGATWSIVKTLEGNPNGWYCYIAVHFVGNDVLLGYCAMSGLAHSRVTKVPVSWLYDGENSKPFDRFPSVFDNVPAGAFTQLETTWGTWAAADDAAEVLKYDRGKGVWLKGGNDMLVTLKLKAPKALKELPLQAERYTARPPYAFVVEAKVDGEWRLVAAQGNETGVGSLRPLPWVSGDLQTAELRFRCSSVMGVILSDERVANLNGFFKD